MRGMKGVTVAIVSCPTAPQSVVTLPLPLAMSRPEEPLFRLFAWGLLLTALWGWSGASPRLSGHGLPASFVMARDDEPDQAGAECPISDETRAALEDIQREAERKRAEAREMDDLRRQAKRVRTARKRSAAPLQAIGALNAAQSRQFALRVQALQQQQRLAAMMRQQVPAARRAPLAPQARPDMRPLLPVPPALARRGPVPNPALGRNAPGPPAFQTFRWPGGGGFVMQWGMPGP
jgi:hypothetical protein